MNIKQMIEKPEEKYINRLKTYVIWIEYKKLISLLRNKFLPLKNICMTKLVSE